MEANGAQVTNESGPECKWIGNRAVRRVANPIDCVPAMWHSMTANYCQGNDVLRSIAIVTQYSLFSLCTPQPIERNKCRTHGAPFIHTNKRPSSSCILIGINKHKQTSALTPLAIIKYATLRKISKLSSWINFFLILPASNRCVCVDCSIAFCEQTVLHGWCNIITALHERGRRYQTKKNVARPLTCCPILLVKEKALSLTHNQPPTPGIMHDRNVARPPCS